MLNFEIKKNKIIFYFFVIFLSIFIAFRVDSLGDTLTYKNNFYNISTIYEANYEPFFKYLSKIIYYFFYNHYVYFFIIAFIFNYFWFRIFEIICEDFKINYYFGILVFTAISLMSSWYFSATTNGLRQGLSLVFLYYGIINFIILEKKLKSLIFIFISVLTHYSSLLLIPFLTLLFFSPVFLYVVFLISAVFYPLGFNEKLVEIFSNLTSIPLHSSISNYLENTNEQIWVGFQINFYLYSIFWASFFFVFDRSDKFLSYLKIYLIFLICFFVFGFGAFSNRFGFMAWLLIPFLQFIFIYRNFCTYKDNRSLLLILLFFIVFFGFTYTLFLYGYLSDLL